VSALLRLIAGLLWVVANATFCGRAHRLLPAKVRLGSFGFIAMTLAFLGASLLRHVVVRGLGFESVLIEQCIYLSVLLWLAGSQHLAELTLYMAASIGVDLVVAAVGAMGMDLSESALRGTALVWEYSAAAVAICRLWVAQAGAGDAQAPQGQDE